MAFLGTSKMYDKIMLNEKIIKCSMQGNMIFVGFKLGRHSCFILSPCGSNETEFVPEMNM